MQVGTHQKGGVPSGYPVLNESSFGMPQFVQNIANSGKNAQEAKNCQNNLDQEVQRTHNLQTQNFQLQNKITHLEAQLQSKPSESNSTDSASFFQNCTVS